MEEIREQQSKGKYRVVILSAIKKYYDYLVMISYRTELPRKRLNFKVNSNQTIQI